MTKQVINVGTTVNDKKGDSLRAAFQKVNSNFTELYTALGLSSDVNLNLGAFEFNGSTTAYRVKTAPTHSYGSSGDLQGDLAFDSTNFYYCISNYGYATETFTVVNTGEYSNSITVNKASNPNYTIPQSGWTVVIGGVTMTLTVYSADHGNGVDYNFLFDNSSGEPLPSAVTLVSTNLKNIWVKQQWGTTGTW